VGPKAKIVIVEELSSNHSLLEWAWTDGRENDKCEKIVLDSLNVLG
jgi:hypothetical protein